MKSNKRGSAIAEAAIVFPVVILVLMTMIYILITLYVDASTSARDRLSLRKESGIMTEVVLREDDFGNIMPEDKFGRKPFTELAEITSGTKFLDKILLTDSSRVYVIDEVEYIRRADLLDELLNGEDKVE
jgi:hypothetical protein